VGSASQLPWPDQSFDLVSQFTVFTSILDPALKQAIAAEMLRVLKPGGAVLWFDFRVNNPANPHVRGIPAREIRSLFAGCHVELASALLAPPLGRRIAGWSWPLAELLHSFPFLRTHYAGLIRKP
jgi:ubiquinone/menaquinone biosynthesis C-methylase UbiE